MSSKFIGNIKGKDAEQPRFSIGRVQSLPYGSSPRVENSGTVEDPVLDFYLVSGRDGVDGVAQDGAPGAPGATGPEGPRGRAATIAISEIQMLPEGSIPEVVNHGNSHDADYTLKIPMGSGAPPEDEFVDNSTNAVQSRVIKAALDEKANISDVPTKTSELDNDASFVPMSTVETMIDDAVDGVVAAANPVDDNLDVASSNAVSNSVITNALNEKVSMEVEDLLDSQNTRIGDTVTLRDGNQEVSMNLMGADVINATLTKTIAGREPTIVATLPDVGDETKLYLVPAGNDNYSMHIWMDVSGEMKYASVSGGNNSQMPDISGLASKSEAIKDITRNETTFTATRCNGTTFAFDQKYPSFVKKQFTIDVSFNNETIKKGLVVDVRYKGYVPLCICACSIDRDGYDLTSEYFSVSGGGAAYNLIFTVEYLKETIPQTANIKVTMFILYVDCDVALVYG